MLLIGCRPKRAWFGSVAANSTRPTVLRSPCVRCRKHRDSSLATMSDTLTLTGSSPSTAIGRSGGGGAGQGAGGEMSGDLDKVMKAELRSLA